MAAQKRLENKRKEKEKKGKERNVQKSLLTASRAIPPSPRCTPRLVIPGSFDQAHKGSQMPESMLNHCWKVPRYVGVQLMHEGLMTVLPDAVVTRTKSENVVPVFNIHLTESAVWGSCQRFAEEKTAAGKVVKKELC